MATSPHPAPHYWNGDAPFNHQDQVASRFSTSTSGIPLTRPDDYPEFSSVARAGPFQLADSDPYTHPASPSRLLPHQRLPMSPYPAPASYSRLASPTRPDVEYHSNGFNSFGHRRPRRRTSWGDDGYRPSVEKNHRGPHSDKQASSCCKHCQADNDRRRRTMALVAALVVVLLYLVGNMIFINVRVMRLWSQNNQGLALAPLTTTAANASNPGALASVAQTCLSQFAATAPSNPTAYPCSSCLTSLQNVSQSYIASNPSDGQQIMNAIQFCGLRGIFESANGDGQTALSNGSWAKDVRFCAWSGVQCDGSGQVSSIQLTFPAVPAKIPNELGALTALTSLQIVGDTNIPAGTFPTSLQSLSALTTLHLETTALTTIEPAALKTLTKLMTLILAKNTAMTSEFLTGVTSLPLVNFVVNNQTLPNPIPALIANPAGKTIRILDLSATSLNGSLSGDLSPLASLVQLHLGYNGIQAPVPSKFPPSLQTLTLVNNAQLTGAVAPNTSFCGLPQLTSCDLRGSGLTAQGNCGPCQFS